MNLRLVLGIEEEKCGIDDWYDENDGDLDRIADGNWNDAACGCIGMLNEGWPPPKLNP